MGDAFLNVVDADGKLVGPASMPVLNGKVSALELRVLCEVPKPQVMPVYYFVWNLDAKGMGGVKGLLSIALSLVNDFAVLVFGILFF